MQPLPIGVKGEIFIGGLPLARGYLKNPEMTKDKFIQDPYYQDYGNRLYKTGDLGRFLRDGNIEVLGRKDDQTKIRGHRIDIGEIEVVLNQCDNIKDSVVVVKNGETKEKYLVAFYVPATHMTNDLSSIRKFLRNNIPEYMIPSFFIPLEKLPMSPNGKIDRKSLTNTKIKVDIDDGYERPYNEIQQKLVRIWEKVLGTDGVGINHHFFEIGGQSLKAITLVSEIHRVFEVEIPLGKVFESPTIKELALLIEETMEKKETYQTISPVAQQDFYKVSAAQKRMYIVSHLSDASTNYNISGAVFLDGKVNVLQLERAFQALIMRHESLRTSFAQANGHIIQIVHENLEWNMEHLYANEYNLDSVVEGFIQPFDLERGPLFRAAIVEMSPSKYLLVYDMHHIISDGLSIGILIREFVSLYQGNTLPKVRIQYKDFSDWQNRAIESGLLKSQEEYWVKTFSQEIPLLNLPTDYRRLDEPLFEGDGVPFNLEDSLTSKLNQISLEKGVTLFSLLLSAFSVLLSKYSGQEDIVVGTPVAGRLHSELENMVGMFVNTLALRNYPDSEMTLENFVKEVANQTVQALEHQEYSFEMLVDKLQLRKSLNRHPLLMILRSHHMNILIERLNLT
jgi:acyl carrier protein